MALFSDYFVTLLTIFCTICSLYEWFKYYDNIHSTIFILCKVIWWAGLDPLGQCLAHGQYVWHACWRVSKKNKKVLKRHLISWDNNGQHCQMVCNIAYLLYIFIFLLCIVCFTLYYFIYACVLWLVYFIFSPPNSPCAVCLFFPRIAKSWPALLHHWLARARSLCLSGWLCLRQSEAE